MADLFKVDKSNLSKKDRIILDYIIRNEKQMFYENSKDIAEKIGISSATIGRFWKKIGYRNIKAFQKDMAERMDTTPASKIKNTIVQLEGNDSSISQIFLKNIKTMEKTIEFLEKESIEEAANLIINHKKIYVFAPDASLGIADIMQYRLRRFGIEFIIMNGGSSIYEYLININKDDLVILFSFSRILTEISIILDHRQNIKFSTIIITDLLSQNLHKRCDCIIYSYRGEPVEYHSMIAPLSVIDCIIIRIAMRLKDSVDHMSKLNQLRSQYQYYIKR